MTTQGWIKRSPNSLFRSDADKTHRAEDWFRIRLDYSFNGLQLGLQNYSWAAYDLYIDGRKRASFENTGTNGKPYFEYCPYSQPAFPLELMAQLDHSIWLFAKSADGDCLGTVGFPNC